MKVLGTQTGNAGTLRRLRTSNYFEYVRECAQRGVCPMRYTAWLRLQRRVA